MKFIKKLFILIVLGAVVFYGYGWYSDYASRDVASPFHYTVNTDISSPLAMVGTLDGGGGFSLYTKRMSDGTEIAESIAVVGEDGATGKITLGNNGLPELYTFAGHTVRYSNYTETTVDVEITKPNGTVEQKTASQIKLASNEPPFTKISYAAEDTPSYAPKYNRGRSNRDYGDGVDDFLYQTAEGVLASPGTALNIVMCTTGAALLQPWASFPCGQLGVRVTTSYVNVPGCKDQDVLDCGVNYIKDNVITQGPTIIGEITDSENNKSVSHSVIEVRKRGTNALVAKAVTLNKGRYVLKNIEPGSYDVYVETGQYADKKFILAITPTALKIANGAGSKVLQDSTFDLGSPKKKRWLGSYGYNVEFNFSLEKEKVTAFDGTWIGEGDSDEDSECVGTAPLNLSIQNGEVTGKIDSDISYTKMFSIDGEVDSSGNLAGKVNIFKKGALGKYSAKITGSSARGTWETIRYGCSGTFYLNKQ